MSATTIERIDAAVAAMGPEPLTEARLQAHVAQLFSRVRSAWRDRIYLANHSLGRPLDATTDDVGEALSAWYAHLGGAWNGWSVEMAAYRARLARLLGAPRPDCVVPKTSAGQGLRTILNTFDGVPRVVATRGEFDSLDVILREYARRGRIVLTLVDARADGLFATDDLVAAVGTGTDLVVLSQVMFTTGQRLDDLPGIVAATHAAGGRVLLDVYHALGVFPFSVADLDVDFAVGGSYKYLRGGPGACFLYIAARLLDGELRTLDTGWFAKREPFSYRRPDPPEYGSGGDAFLESTPPVLPLYQARAGQVLTLAIGVPRLRAWSLSLQRQLVERLAKHGVSTIGGTENRGAFVVVRAPDAPAWSERLADAGVVTDARGDSLRLCPDLLTTDAELTVAAEAVGRTRR